METVNVQANKVLNFRKPLQIRSEIRLMEAFNAQTPLQQSNKSLRLTALQNELEETLKHFPETPKTESELLNDKAAQLFGTDKRFSITE